MISRMPLLYLCAQRVRGAVAEPVLVPEKAQVQAAQMPEQERQMPEQELRLGLKQERPPELQLALRLEPE
jgi:hypothetical protein